MSQRFDPNFAPHLEADWTDLVVVTEPGSFGGGSNLVIDRSKSFDISVKWHVFGDLTPVWLTALAVASPNWKVTAYAESIGPGDEKQIAVIDVPVNPGPGLDRAYSAKMTVPPFTLSEENPGDPTQSGTYKLVVTAFLDSTLGAPGYDIMGYNEGPVIKVEDPQ